MMSRLIFRPVYFFLIALILVGCDNVPVDQNFVTTNANSRNYTGPEPATADVQSFKTNVWDNLVDKCGACHGTGGQSPSFVQDDDINLAYSQAITVVDLGAAENSRLVTKVGGGHNCWESSTAACAAIMTAFIQNWVGGSADDQGRQIVLETPTEKDAGDSKSYPEDSSLFSATVYPLLTAYCADCHAESAQLPQAPYFASSDVDAAFDAVKTSQKLDLDTPSNSRLVVRLRSEFHNCWEDCQDDADEMQQAVTNFANGIIPTQIDPQLVLSKALSLGDGTIASGGSRHEENVIALYQFKEGQGSTIYDVSGISPLLHLQLSGVEDVDYKWVGGWGVEFLGGKAQGTTSASKKLSDFIKASGEYSIEAWAVPANVTQEGPASIISYSAGLADRNVTLGQTLYNYDYLHRSSSTDSNGEPALSTDDDDEDLQATEQHVVITYDPVNGRGIYVNGVFTDDLDGVEPGNLGDWDDTYALVFGNEVTGNRPWHGKLRLVAIHNRALNPSQIQKNFEAGVGEKFYLLFSVEQVVGVPQSYILLEVSQFDSYSYLFSQPMFISLDMNADPGSFRIAGMRLGINGKESAVGQAYVNVDTTITSSAFVKSEQFNAKAQSLSELGTIIPLEKGVDADEFFLSFEVLADKTNVFVEPQPLQSTASVSSDLQPDIGLRIFAEVNATMAEITDVAITQSDVQATYETIKQQLPVVESVGGFLSSHQVAISQLAVEYCNALVNDISLRSSFFPGFDFSRPANTAFDATGRSQVITPLLGKIAGTGLVSQPLDADLRSELDSLINKLTACGGSCAADRTEVVVKSACAAMMGSAVMLIQ